MRRRLTVVAICGAVGVAVIAQQPLRPPAPISVSWPFALAQQYFGPGDAGEARFRVTVDGGSVTSVNTVGQPERLLDAPGREAIQQWKFAQGPQTSFDIALIHKKEGAGGCEGDFNQIVRVIWPRSIEIVSKKFVTICDPTVTGISFLQPYRELEGVLTCDCPGAAPIAGAELTIHSGRRNVLRRTIRTDTDGHFRAGGLPPGEYLIRAPGEGYLLREYRVRIAQDGVKAQLDLSLVPDQMKPVDTLVTGGTIPGYPPQARRLGEQGTVQLRLSMKGDEILDIDTEGGVPDLATAAAANVRTWRFRETSTPVLKVRFDYRLVSGDCEKAEGPIVTMTFPARVEIKAVGPCATRPGPS